MLWALWQIWIKAPAFSSFRPGQLPISLYSDKSPTAPVTAATHCFFKGLNKTRLILPGMESSSYSWAGFTEYVIAGFCAHHYMASSVTRTASHCLPSAAATTAFLLGLSFV